MGIFIDKIKSIFNSGDKDHAPLTAEIKELMAFRKELLSILEKDQYIARSDFSNLQH